MANKIILMLYVLSTSLALIVLKIGAREGAPASLVDGRLQFNFNVYTASGIILYGLSFLTYMYLISKHDLGYIIPLTTALVYIVIFTASFLIFKEPFTALKVAAIVLIIGGVLLLSSEVPQTPEIR